LKKVIVMGLAALWIGAAGAEQLHGVEVYAGAKPEPSTNQFLKEGLKMDGRAFVTGDSVEKVVAFYAKQPGMKQMPGADAKQAGFTGKGVHVTIQNPWLDVKTSKVNNTTLVSIVKQK
jgi:hypothetical protein